ncbi:protein of unknown function [Salinimicrobium catena]|uniref:DUF4252 domain-containing protein n=1 Tax=Salinimicrobium catena TaxID=390640 RepID=A0A1H5P3G3_9FLAO|nr:DUF4252 domain-containing protein [Salinimicrobium catena]SDL67151.1 protein of unknown function [Salinimicrobium catena]SEF08406.1 protein of unknown function [Salinimicrobium catena]
MKKTVLILVLLTLGLVSCENETSLQEFYVENQNDKQYLAFDIPASLLTGENSKLTAEQKATLETIRKVNILGFPKKAENEDAFREEQEKLSNILKSDKYNLLMKYGGGDRKAELYYMGEEDAIDELIVFGSDEEKGFGIARVTGDDMNPEAIIKLFRSFEKGELDVQGLQNFNTMFKD